MHIVGIDLGTTNSLISTMINGQPTIIPNIHGETLTPSIVSVGDNGEIYVGSIARERQVTHPAHTASVFKRSMGTKKGYQLGQSSFTPEELSSFIIKKLKEDAEAYLKEEVTEAIISVPAYFNDAQRRATKLAGELAGLKVERIVNEPTAASLAYGFHEANEHAKFLVFDLGGGTFDVSILEKYKNIMEVRAVAGDVFLGGEDFTDILMDLFIRKASLDTSNLTLSEHALLRKQIDTAKARFSESRTVNISCPINNEIYEAAINFNEYERACQELLNRLRIPIKSAMSDASLRLSDISSIILVGGGTKLPIVRNFTTKLFGRFPHSSLSPDEVVGIGAAVHAGLKERNESISEIVLTDVCPFTLGVDSVVTQQNGLHVYDVFLPIIERNSTIPISRVERVSTLHDQQSQIHLLILQGESRRSSENSQLGELTVPIPKASAGKESADVRFTYDINGILECEVTIVSTQLKKAIIIEKNPGIFTKDEIQEKLQALAAYRLHPRDKDEYRLLLSRGERLYQETLGDTRRYIGSQLMLFDQVLNTQDERKIREFIPQFKDLLESMEKGELQ
ncbi:MAG: molecular chaperone HscC [Defluviitaleaceae bacterium]|nr:molecular chaperone HscC [Defluviitaleaceae bacterium]